VHEACGRSPTYLASSSPSPNISGTSWGCASFSHGLHLRLRPCQVCQGPSTGSQWSFSSGRDHPVAQPRHPRPTQRWQDTKNIEDDSANQAVSSAAATPPAPPSTHTPHRAATSNALGKHRLGVEAAVLGWKPTHRAVLHNERVRHGRGGAAGAAALASAAATGGSRVRRRRVGGLRVGPRAARRRRGRRARRRVYICWGRHGRHGRALVGGARGSVTGAEGQKSAARERGGRSERGPSCSDFAVSGHDSRKARLDWTPISTASRILFSVCRTRTSRS